MFYLQPGSQFGIKMRERIFRIQPTFRYLFVHFSKLMRLRINIYINVKRIIYICMTIYIDELLFK